MSDFEKEITKGRFLLEKKTWLKLSNSAWILHADYCVSN